MKPWPQTERPDFLLFGLRYRSDSRPAIVRIFTQGPVTNLNIPPGCLPALTILIFLILFSFRAGNFDQVSRAADLPARFVNGEAYFAFTVSLQERTIA